MPNWVLLLVSSLREKVTFNARYRDSSVINARMFTTYHSIFLIAACSYHFPAPEGSTTSPGLMSRALSPYQLHPIMAPLPEKVLRVPKALHTSPVFFLGNKTGKATGDQSGNHSQATAALAGPVDLTLP